MLQSVTMNLHFSYTLKTNISHRNIETSQFYEWLFTDHETLHLFYKMSSAARVLADVVYKGSIKNALSDTMPVYGSIVIFLRCIIHCIDVSLTK